MLSELIQKNIDVYFFEFNSYRIGKSVVNDYYFLWKDFNQEIRQKVRFIFELIIQCFFE